MSTDITDGSGLDPHITAATVYNKLRAMLAGKPDLAIDRDPALVNNLQYSSYVRRGFLLGILFMWLISDHKKPKLEELFAMLRKSEALITWLHIELTGENTRCEEIRNNYFSDSKPQRLDLNEPSHLIAEILPYRNDLLALRSRLAHARDLRNLIADPPIILMDEKQHLTFYRGIQIKLQPACFQCILILAKNPQQIVMRDEIYRRLWPGEISYSGANKPYEIQLSDHKRRGIAQIKKGLEGKIVLAPRELESLILTMPKVGYMLNVAKEDVVILP
ncbi:MAG: helix-turn-helix domain-containing protein [Deltaproteobacteria bacterium]|nr:helix-turn-helix domain-containing protein [Deltaproteobacteria bacterium]